jgi:hypothetical protein
MPNQAMHYCVLSVPRSGLFYDEARGLMTGEERPVVADSLPLFTDYNSAVQHRMKAQRDWLIGDRHGEQWSFVVLPVKVQSGRN